MAHTVVYRVAMHYLTDNVQSTVEQIIRREKKLLRIILSNFLGKTRGKTNRQQPTVQPLYQKCPLKK